MALETINIGNSANDGTGDDLRTAFQKVKNNFSTLAATSITNVVNIGDGEHIYHPSSTVDNRDTLSLKTLIAGDNIRLSSTNETIVISGIKSINSLVQDDNPMLSNDLNTNGFKIKSINSNIKIESLVWQSVNYNPVHINSISITGGNSVGSGTTVIRSEGNLEISSGSSLTFRAGTGQSDRIILNSPVFASSIECSTFSGNTYGIHFGDVVGNITGNLTGNTTGIHTGSVVGNVGGTVSDISNHSIRALSDVSLQQPSLGQILMWNGFQYYPTTMDNLVLNDITISGPEINTVDSSPVEIGTTLHCKENIVIDSHLYIQGNIVTNSLQSYNNSIDIKSPLRLARFSSTERDSLSSQNGDIIYNTTEHKFQGFQNGSWVDLSL